MSTTTQVTELNIESNTQSPINILQLISTVLSKTSVVVSSASALFLSVWGIILYKNWAHIVVGDNNGCSEKLILNLVLSMCIIDIFSAALGSLSLYLQHTIGQNLKSLSEETQDRYNLYSKVDSIVRFITGFVLGGMKNVMVYLLWFSSCRIQSKQFYEQVHTFLVVVIARVAVSVVLQLTSLLFKYLYNKYESMKTTVDCEQELEMISTSSL
ncbi:ATP-dependent RNA helicase DHH [Acrasis kona]|uniref:ATP-dependent RNA helicase DHH n=1 Tax=Acrasis kona TaxID=1008807 RepID=A0AAW2YXR2_9EUKA